jgi:hypothetical protein
MKLRREEVDLNPNRDHIPLSCPTISSTSVNTSHNNSSTSLKTHQNISQKTTTSVDTGAATILMGGGCQGVQNGVKKGISSLMRDVSTPSLMEGNPFREDAETSGSGNDEEDEEIRLLFGGNGMDDYDDNEEELHILNSDCSEKDDSKDPLSYDDNGELEICEQLRDDEGEGEGEGSIGALIEGKEMANVEEVENLSNSDSEVEYVSPFIFSAEYNPYIDPDLGHAHDGLDIEDEFGDGWGGTYRNADIPGDTLRPRHVQFSVGMYDKWHVFMYGCICI